VEHIKVMAEIYMFCLVRDCMKAGVLICVLLVHRWLGDCVIVIAMY
jgi:hypothetical protein